jgi:hypothetical protein
MPKRSSKRLPADLRQRAKRIVGIAAGDVDAEKQGSSKNPHAVALGRLGGQKGGAARASSLSAKRRQQIAKAAAAARWKTDDS